MDTSEAMRRYCRVAESVCPASPSGAPTAPSELAPVTAQRISPGPSGKPPVAEGHRCPPSEDEELGAQDFDRTGGRGGSDGAETGVSARGTGDGPLDFRGGTRSSCGRSSTGSLQGGAADGIAERLEPRARWWTTLVLPVGAASVLVLAFVAGLGIPVGSLGDDGGVPGEGSDADAYEAHGLRVSGGILWRSIAWLSAPPLLLVTVVCLLWAAARVARWREEIFAGSQVVSEVMARVNAPKGGQAKLFPTAKAAASPRDCARGGTVDSCEGDPVHLVDPVGPMDPADPSDPIGELFGPGSEASRAFGPGGAGDDGGSGGEDGVAVFLTGVTGLVGQMVLFDLLKHGGMGAGNQLGHGEGGDGGKGGDGDGGIVRSCGAGVVGRLRRVYVMVRRSRKGMRGSERLEALRDSPMFRELRDCGAWSDDDSDGRRRSGGERKGTIVSVVEGDLTQEGLGLTRADRELLGGAGITHALHCAASVKFNDPMPEAALTNVTGALRVAALVASWPSCRCGANPSVSGRVSPP